MVLRQLGSERFADSLDSSPQNDAALIQACFYDAQVVFMREMLHRFDVCRISSHLFGKFRPA
jgi:hypothetical protein